MRKLILPLMLSLLVVTFSLYAWLIHLIRDRKMVLQRPNDFESKLSEEYMRRLRHKRNVSSGPFLVSLNDFESILNDKGEVLENSDLDSVSNSVRKYSNNDYSNRNRNKIISNTISNNISSNINNSTSNINKSDNDCLNDESHGELKRLFQLWVKMAQLLNVRYALTHGTLLGSWRNSEMIPYDTDLDVMVNHEEVPKLLIMADTSFDESDNKVHLTIQRDYLKPIDQRSRFRCNGYRTLSRSRMDQCSFIEPLGRLIRGHYLHIDIVGFEMSSSTNTVVFKTEDSKTVFNTSMILPFTKCRFISYDTFCPRDTEKFLRDIYDGNLEPNKRCVNGRWVS